MERKTKRKNVKLSKELIEHFVSQHYRNSKNYVWDNNGISFDAYSKKPDVDIDQLMAQNKLLAERTILLQGAIEYSASLIKELVKGV